MTIKPYYQSDRVTLYHGDCLAILPTLGAGSVDAVVTDPPYGMKYVGHSGGGRTCHSGKKFNRTSDHIKATILGDDKPFDPLPWLLWPCVFSGANWFYDRLPPGGSLHSWDKRGEYKRFSFADADIIWCSRRVKSQTFRLVWRGICRHAENNNKIVHPTQKPVALTEWMIGLSGVDSDATILDPFMGSGTTGVACIKTGRRFIGIEIDEKYCEVAAKRIQDAERESAESLVPA